jgi:hypothetical protein
MILFKIKSITIIKNKIKSITLSFKFENNLFKFIIFQKNVF